MNERARACIAAALVATASFLLYVALYSELPIDDTDRFTASVAARVFQWDPAHLLMQPATVVWHAWLSFGQPALTSQHTINSASAACALAVFWLLLRRLSVGCVPRCVLVFTAAIASNVLTLATSGHMKLLALPFLALALYHAVLWEREPAPGARSRLLWSGAMLGIATAFLVNSIVILPFQCLAVALHELRARRAARAIALDVGALACATVGATGVLFTLCYIASTNAPLGVTGLVHFVLGSPAREAGWPSGLAEKLARLAFATVQNFTFSERLGPTLRAWLSHDITDLGAQLRAIWIELAAVLVSGTILAATYALALAAWLRKRSACGAAWAHILGTLAFASVFNLSEPEFYYQITLPTLLLPALLPSSAVRRACVWILALVLVVTNLVGHALPNRSYPLQEYAREMRERFNERDLLVSFNAYPGRQYLGFFKPELPGREVLEIDLLYVELRAPEPFFRALERRLAAAGPRGGRVFVFGVLDESDWNAPWPYLGRLGLSKPALLGFLRTHYEVVERGEIAEIRCWELR